MAVGCPGLVWQKIQEPLTKRGMPSLHFTYQFERDKHWDYTQGPLYAELITIILLLMSTGQSPAAAPADDIVMRIVGYPCNLMLRI